VQRRIAAFQLLTVVDNGGVHLADPEQLEQIGLVLYERKALMALMLCGVADAATLCREGSVPTSKIYLAMEKLARLGLVQMQPTRPKMFAALPTDVVVNRIIEIARERSERFAADAATLHATFAGLRSRARGRQPFLDLALGIDGHIRRHLVPLAAARKRILSYMEAGDLMAIDAAVNDGFPILRRIAKNAAEHGVEHRVVFGFSYQSAGHLLEFLKQHRQDLKQVTGVRYSGELGHPFHVVDDETVVLPLDHPFVKEGRFASLLVRDRELADSLAEGFQELWRKAMRSLREIQVDPRGHKT
jgi:HTH-type transcriptional regulator, sugar sensing transcriptional regulator